MSARCWSLLGIAPTADERAIRSAYAAKLKTIDPEADAAAFIALRAALQQAQAHARSADARAAGKARPARVKPEPPPVEEQAVSPAAADEAVAAPEPTAPPPPDHFAEIHRLVFGEAPREAIFDAVARHAEAILAAPEMDGLPHAAAVENWLADTILRGIPRTNALLAPAINRFRWIDRARDYNCPPAIRHILDRYRDCTFKGQLWEQPATPLGRALRLVTAPGEVRRRGWTNDAPSVEQLLEILRTRHPSLMAELDPVASKSWIERIERRRDAWYRRWPRLAGERVKQGRGWLLVKPWRLNLAFLIVVALVVLLATGSIQTAGFAVIVGETLAFAVVAPILAGRWLGRWLQRVTAGGVARGSHGAIRLAAVGTFLRTRNLFGLSLLACAILRVLFMRY